MAYFWPAVRKKKGDPWRAPFFCPLIPGWLFLGWEKKVNRFLRGWFCGEANDKIDD